MLGTPKASIGILLFGLTVLVIGLAINASLLFDAFAPPAVTYSNPAPVLNNPVTAGSPIDLEVTRHAWNITGSAPVPLDFQRRLVRLNDDGSDIQPMEVMYLDTVSLAADPGDTVVRSRLTVIPANTPPGLWRLEGYAFARHKSSPFYTTPIRVVAP